MAYKVSGGFGGGGFGGKGLGTVVAGKSGGGGGGFLGTGVGPDVSLNDIYEGPKGIVTGLANFGAGIGAAGYHLAAAGGHGLGGLLGDKHEAQLAGQDLKQATDFAGRTALGMQSSAFNTAGDISGLGDFASQKLGLGDPGLAKFWRDTGRSTLAQEAQWATGSPDVNPEISQVAKELGPRTWSARAKAGGYLAPIAEDVGNVAAAGGLLTKGLGLAEGARTGTLGEALAHPTDSSLISDLSTKTKAPMLTESESPAIAGAAKVAERMGHPLRSLYRDTLGSLANAVAERKLGTPGVSDAAQSFYDAAGKDMGLEPPTPIDPRITMEPGLGAKLANEYQKLPTDMAHLTPDEQAKVKASYDALNAATHAAHEHMVNNLGITPEVVERADNAYTLPDGSTDRQAMMNDIEQNKHLYVDNTSPDEGHPYMTPEQNNEFRAVHDFYGHAQAGNDFGANGEEAAFQHHAQITPPDAMSALANETRGQNTELNFSADNIGKAPGTKEFGPQRVGTLPEDMTRPGYTSQPIEGSPTAADVAQRATQGPGPIARGLASHINPEGFAGSALDKLSRLSVRNSVGNIFRELGRNIEMDTNAAMHSPAAAASAEAIRAVQAATGMSPTAANKAVHEELWNRITPTGAELKAAIEANPAIEPYFDKVGLHANPIPPEALAHPEVEAAVAAAEEQWRQSFAEQPEAFKANQPGAKGLEDIGSESPTLTKAQKIALKDAQGKQQQAVKLMATAEKQMAQAKAKLLNLQDRQARQVLAMKQAIEDGTAQTTRFDKVRGALGFRNDAKWAKRRDEMVQTTMEKGGATYNPFADRHIVPKAFGGTDGGWSTSLLPESQYVIPKAQFATDGAGVIDQLAHEYQDLFKNRDFEIGTWVDGKDMVHVDISQHTLNGHELTRDQALLMGSARQQEAIFGFDGGQEIKLGPVMSPLVSAHVINETGRNFWRDKTAQAIRKAVEQTHLDPATGEPVKTYPNLSHEDVDSIMAQRDFMAYNATRLNPGKFKTPEDYYKTVLTEMRKSAAQVPADAFLQTFLNKDVNLDLWNEAHRAVDAGGTDFKQAAKWYFKSRDGIEKAFRGKTVTLPNGHPVDMADLMYDLVALTSVNADPITNMGSALTALANTKELTSAIEQGDLDRVMAQLAKINPKMKMEHPLTKAVVAPGKVFNDAGTDTQLAHMYSDARRTVAERIIGGKPLADWTEDDIRNANARWGGRVKSLSNAVVPEGQSWMEYHGSEALAKIRSFEDNLRNPETSTNVTLDSWMARLFGVKDWQAKGSYSAYADKVRALADEVSAQEGHRVMPHEIQAGLWAYAKQEVTRQVAGEFRAASWDTGQQILDGEWKPSADPMDAWLKQQEQELKDAGNRQFANQQRSADIKARVKELQGGGVKAGGMSETKAKAQAAKEFGPKGADVFQQQTHTARIMDKVTGKVTEEPVSTAIKSVAENQNKTLTSRRAAYDELRTQMHDLIAQGKESEAVNLLTSWENETLRSMEKGSEGVDFGSILNAPRGKTAEAVNRLQTLDPNALFQKFDNQINGAKFTKGEKIINQFFKTADFTTFMHEGGHALRDLLPPGQIAVLEREYGIVGHAWTREAEERFADDMVAYMNTHQAPAGLEGAFGRVHSTLEELYSHQIRRFDGGNLTQGVSSVFDRWFQAPEASVLDSVPGTKIKLLPGTNTPIIEGEKGTIAQRVRRPPATIEAGTKKGAYGTGVQARDAAQKIDAARKKVAESAAAVASTNADIEGLKKDLATGNFPAAIQATGLNASADKTMASIIDQVGSAGTSRWPREYQPVGWAFDSLAEMAKTDPELATILHESAPAFKDVLARAQELGANPQHIRDFTDAQVKRMIWDTQRIGRGGQGLGKAFEAGTRHDSTGMLQKTGTAARSLEAFTASWAEVSHEKNTNALVDHLQRYVAHPIKGGDTLPKGWDAWDPVRRGNLEIKQPDGSRVAAQGTSYMIPHEVATYLKRQGQDYSHGAFSVPMKMLHPWKTAVLTLSPHFYVTRVIGHMVLTMADGAPLLRDWHKAWESYKSKDYFGHFADVPAIRGHSEVDELGAHTMVGNRNLKDALQSAGTPVQKLNALRHQVAQNMRNVINVTDGLGRAAVYHKTLRQTGSEMQAAHAAYARLGDYGDLSPAEQQMVRAIVPFYAWQKAILKITAKLPVDHPLALAIALRIGALQQQQMEDQYGTALPDAYAGLFNLASNGGKGGGAFNVGRLNPFSEAGSLVTPDGIGNSLSPYVQAAARYALNAPSGGFVTSRTMSPYGTAVPNAEPGQTLADTFTSIPGAAEGSAIAGKGNYPAGQQSLKFAGINYLTPADVKKIVTRTKKAKAQIASNSPFPAK